MSWYEQPDPVECLACSGEGKERWEMAGRVVIVTPCEVCEGTGYMTATERREYIADARADSTDD